MNKNENGEFFVVGLYDTEYEAYVVQTLLADNGIESQVLEGTNIYPGLTLNGERTKLIANSTDKEKIEQIISSKEIL